MVILKKIIHYEFPTTLKKSLYIHTTVYTHTHTQPKDDFYGLLTKDTLLVKKVATHRTYG